jgi:hypothetical protein
LGSSQALLIISSNRQAKHSKASATVRVADVVNKMIAAAERNTSPLFIALLLLLLLLLPVIDSSSVQKALTNST